MAFLHHLIFTLWLYLQLHPYSLFILYWFNFIQAFLIASIRSACVLISFLSSFWFNFFKCFLIKFKSRELKDYLIHQFLFLKKFILLILRCASDCYQTVIAHYFILTPSHWKGFLLKCSHKIPCPYLNKILIGILLFYLTSYLNFSHFSKIRKVLVTIL